MTPSLNELAHKIKEAWRILEANVDPPDRDVSGYVNTEKRIIKEYIEKHPNFSIDQTKLNSLLCGPL